MNVRRFFDIRILVLFFLTYLVIENQNYINSNLNLYSTTLEAKNIKNYNKLNINDLRHWIKEKNGTNRILIVYASWCNACKKKIPFILKLLSSLSDKNIQLMFISIDNNSDIINQYMTNELNFSNYIADESLRYNLKYILSSYNLTFNNTIPFVGLINTNNEGVVFKNLSELATILRANKNITTANKVVNA